MKGSFTKYATTRLDVGGSWIYITRSCSHGRSKSAGSTFSPTLPSRPSRYG